MRKILWDINAFIKLPCSNVLLFDITYPCREVQMKNGRYMYTSDEGEVERWRIGGEKGCTGLHQ